MTETLLTRFIGLARCIPRVRLDLSEEIFRIERSREEVLRRLDAANQLDSVFGRLSAEIEANPNVFDEAILVLRSAILTRSRHAVHSPKAVCTLPDTKISGMDDTQSETLRLIREATHSISLMNYWMTSGSEILIQTLMEKVRSNPRLRVVVVGDSRENFLVPFRRMWKRDVPEPAIYIYKPGMSSGAEDRSKMHAKTLVIDECKMLISSANMTKAAVSENIEVGISIEAPKAVRKIAEMINHLIHRPDLFERIS